MNKKIVIMEITNICNNDCVHCLRPIRNTFFKMTYDEVKTAIEEIAIFSRSFNNFELKLSGGEATIWKDKEKDLTDIIKLCKNSGINFSVVTNGLLFRNMDYCIDFIRKLKSKGIEEITLYITIDYFHNNYFGQNNNILDNLLEISKLFKINLNVQSTISKSNDRNIDLSFIKKYSIQGVHFKINPLLPWGKGESLNDQYPTLNIGNNCKSNLGDYKLYGYILAKECGLCNSFNEFIQCNNLDFLKEICDCGKSMVLSNGNYYYCLGLMSDDRFSFAQLGELSYEKYFTFIEQNDWIKKMKKAEIEISNKEVPVAFGLCDICYNKFSKNFKSR